MEDADIATQRPITTAKQKMLGSSFTPNQTYFFDVLKLMCVIVKKTQLGLAMSRAERAILWHFEVNHLEKEEKEALKGQ